MRHALLLSLVVACSSSSSTPAKPTPPTPTTDPASTGPLTEAQFKALHELPPESAPAPKGEMIDLAGGKHYLALPAGPGPHPGIIVIHEFWGLNGHMKHWADRLAGAGYAALALDLYKGTVAADRDGAMAAMKAVVATEAMTTIRGGLDFLTNDARIKAPVQAVIGWCFGGAWSLQTAMAQPDVDAAIIYYGRLETDPAKLGTIKARVLGVFGTRDAGIPNAEVDKFEAALQQAGVKATIHRYDADHAFANPSNVAKYDEKNASDAWAKVLAFLDEVRR
jgi:carboxymethylenebutenolidase